MKIKISDTFAAIGESNSCIIVNIQTGKFEKSVPINGQIQTMFKLNNGNLGFVLIRWQEPLELYIYNPKTNWSIAYPIEHSIYTDEVKIMLLANGEIAIKTNSYDRDYILIYSQRSGLIRLFENLKSRFGVTLSYDRECIIIHSDNKINIYYPSQKLFHEFEWKNAIIKNFLPLPFNQVAILSRDKISNDWHIYIINLLSGQIQNQFRYESNNTPEMTLLDNKKFALVGERFEPICIYDMTNGLKQTINNDMIGTSIYYSEDNLVISGENNALDTFVQIFDSGMKEILNIKVEDAISSNHEFELFLFQYKHQLPILTKQAYINAHYDEMEKHAMKLIAGILEEDCSLVANEINFSTKKSLLELSSFIEKLKRARLTAKIKSSLSKFSFPSIEILNNHEEIINKLSSYLQQEEVKNCYDKKGYQTQSKK